MLIVVMPLTDTVQQLICQSRPLRASRIFALFLSTTILLSDSNLTLATESTAIREMTPTEIRFAEPTLHDKFFRNGNPRGYIRHRLVHIDTATLRAQLRTDYDARTNGEAMEGVLLSLFPDRHVIVVVDDWMEGSFGVTSAFGTIQDPDGHGRMFEAHFTDTGRVDASFFFRDSGVLVAHLQDFTHYVVMEVEQNGRID